MNATAKTLRCRVAALAALGFAALFIVTAGDILNSPVTVRRAATVKPATLVMSVRTVPQGLQISGILLREPDRVPAQAQDRVFSLTPSPGADSDLPFTWRALLARPQAVHHA